MELRNFEKSIYIAKTWQKGKKSLLNLFNCFKPIFELPKNPILCVHSITNIHTLSYLIVQQMFYVY